MRSGPRRTFRRPLIRAQILRHPRLCALSRVAFLSNSSGTALPVSLIATHGARLGRRVCPPPARLRAPPSRTQKPSRQAKADAVGGGSRAPGCSARPRQVASVPSCSIEIICAIQPAFSASEVEQYLKQASIIRRAGGSNHSCCLVSNRSRGSDCRWPSAHQQSKPIPVTSRLRRRRTRERVTPTTAGRPSRVRTKA